MTTLITGGNGKTGRRVVRRLTERGLPVRVGSRSGEPPFDWTDQGTWGAALRDVRSAYLAYYPDMAAPGAAEAIGAFAELAVRQGVRRLVLLSGRGEEAGWPTEQAVQDSGAEWTILRSSWFAQNFSEAFLREPILAGEVTLPVDSVPEPFIDVEDIADVAVAALTEDRHAGQIYELTGPRLLTFAEAVDEIAEATGRTLRYVPVSVTEFAEILAQHEIPADYVTFLTELFATVLDGRNASLTDGVHRALGRAPRDFTDYVKEAAASGAWD